EQAKVKGLDVTDICTSPKTYQIEDAGQYVVTIFAVHESSGTTGLPIQIEFGIGTGGQPYPNANANFGTGGMVPENALLSEQVGDLFSVSIPQGFHLVSRTSTFDTPGFLTYQFINGGYAVDSAMPYAYRCSQEQEQFTTIDQLVMSSGASFEYCTKTPSLAWNSPATPIGNQFRWDTMSTMSYNSIVIASDNSLKDRRPQGAAKPTMAKLSANVFTNVTGVANDSFSRMFATELNQTVSRMNVSCAGQKPVFLGNAMIFEGYFQWNPVMSPLFGCVTKRNSQWYVEIGAFPMDQNRAILPNQGWTPWIGQDFGNTRAAEIVVEVGPFPYAPAPESVAPDAQALMLQNMKKLLPSPAMDPVTPIITPGPNPCNPCEPRRRFWNRH
ncbi:MAG: hypothetical protein NTV34_01170, partial [Proteobacteria bacterium]|nr:hypothetical protein [Pseudomonadota bacterium]